MSAKNTDSKVEHRISARNSQESASEALFEARRAASRPVAYGLPSAADELTIDNNSDELTASNGSEVEYSFGRPVEASGGGVSFSLHAATSPKKRYVSGSGEYLSVNNNDLDDEIDIADEFDQLTRELNDLGVDHHDHDLEGKDKTLKRPGAKKHLAHSLNALPFYDSLRGISAICVLFHHTWLGIISANIDKSSAEFIDRFGPTRWILYGTWHVYLFFALSGRVIAMRYLVKGDHAQLLSSIIKRPFRLALPMLAALFIIYIIYSSKIYVAMGFNTAYTDEIIKVNPGWNYIDYSPPVSSPSWLPPVVIYISDAFRSFTFSSTAPGYPAGVLWTLPVECFYSYYIYLLAFMTVCAPSKRMAAIVLAAFTIHTLFYQKAYMFFVLGYVICYLSVNGYFSIFTNPQEIYLPLHSPPRFSTIHTLVLTLTSPVCFILSLLLMWTDTLHPLFHFLSTSLLSSSPDTPLGWPRGQDFLLDDLCAIMFLFIALESGKWLQSIFSHPILTYSGRLSFGVYLMHGPLLPLAKICLAALIRWGWHAGSAWTVTVALIPFLLAVWGAAHCFVVFVDESIVRLLSWSYKKLTSL